MWQPRWKFDFIAGFGLVLVLLAYFGAFGEQGVLYYLVHTPYPLVLLPTLVVIGYYLWQKKLLLFTSILILAAGVYLELFAARTVSLARDTVESEENIRVCSWNTAFFFMWGVEAGMSNLQNAHCDVILLQEVWKSESRRDYLTTIFSQYFPDKVLTNHGEFLFLTPKSGEFSLNQEIVTHEGFSVGSLNIQGQNFTLINIHLWTPVAARPWVSNGITGYDNAIAVRSRQTGALLNYLNSATEGTTIIMGDFNTMQNGKILRDIPRAGSGYRFISSPLATNRNTYSISHRLLNIDFALISKEKFPGTTLRKTCTNSGSDHCLLILDLVL